MMESNQQQVSIESTATTTQQQHDDVKTTTSSTNNGYEKRNSYSNTNGYHHGKIVPPPPPSSVSYNQNTNNNNNSNQNQNNNNSNSNGNSHPQYLGWGSRSVEIFEKIEQVGEGTFGQVYKARSKTDNEIVALKRVIMENEVEGFPITAIREIKILRELDHKNVIKLKEIVTSKASSVNNGKGSVYMVFEYMDHDLNGLMDSPAFKFFNPEQCKCYLKQLLEGLEYCHRNNVLHRDIKGSNLLLNNQGILKLADFGLARPYNGSDPKRVLTNRVITLWYRPPELLLGSLHYGPEIDMWSVGCIMAELLSKKTLFPGRSPIDQLDKIFQACGTPTEESWPTVKDLPWWKSLQPKKQSKSMLREIFVDKTFWTPEALDLIEKLLTLDPSKRIKASDALDSPYFWTKPLPCDPSQLPKYPSCHEFKTKKRRQQQQQQQQQQQGQQQQAPQQNIPQQQPPMHIPQQMNEKKQRTDINYQPTFNNNMGPQQQPPHYGRPHNQQPPLPPHHHHHHQPPPPLPNQPGYGRGGYPPPPHYNNNNRAPSLPTNHNSNNQNNY